MNRTYRLIVVETLTHVVEIEASGPRDVKRAYRQAVNESVWSDLHDTIANQAHIASITEVQP